MIRDSLDITRSDQALSLPKGTTLVSESNTHHACKISSNVSDGMEWWNISGTDGSMLQTISPLEVEPRWVLE